MTRRADFGPTATAHPSAPLAFWLMVALIVSLQFGPFIGLLGFRATGSTGFTLIGSARDGLVSLLVLIGAVAWLSSTGALQLPASARWAVVMVIVYFGFAFASDEHPVLIALNLRRIVLVPLLFTALLVIPWSRVQLQRLLFLVIGSTLVVALVGLVERFSPDALWSRVLAVQEFQAANPLDPWGNVPFEYNGRFFSWDLEILLGGTKVRRLVATYLEPTTLAPALAIGLLLAVGLRSRLHYGSAAAAPTGWQGACLHPLAALALLAAGMLTVSKGFLLFVVLLLSWRVLGVPAPRHVFSLAALAVAVAFTLGGAGLYEGPYSHAAGLSSALRYLADGHWLGEGLAAGGNYTDSDLDVGTESGLGNSIVQIGLAAFLPFFWIRAIAAEMAATSLARRDPAGPWISAWLILWLMTYLLSASSLGVGGNALGFSVLALYLHPAWGREPSPLPDGLAGTRS